MYDFSGKVVVITGAARMMGIGRASAVRFAREGADVAIVSHGRQTQNLLETERLAGWRGIDSVAEEIRALGRRALPITADVTKADEVEAMVEKAVAEFGRIDIMVNNAGANVGIDRGGIPVVELPEEVWDRIMDVNLKGTFLCCKAVARHMIARGGGGVIVNVASSAGKKGLAKSAAYSASKAGVVVFTQTLSQELIPYGIRVNALSPGRTGTSFGDRDTIGELMRSEGLSREEAANKMHESILAATPMGRVGRPEEQAAVIAFLASDESSYMMGQSINVTGGRIMH